MLMDEKLLSKDRDQAKGNYAVVHNEENPPLGLFDKPLPFCGCGIGWFSFLLGFVFPVMWYFATVLYFCNYYQRDPRERSGLAASAIAAMMCTIGLAIAVLIILF